MEESRTEWRDEFEEFLEACLEGASDKTMSNISFRNRIAQVATQYLEKIKREKPPERRSEPKKIGREPERLGVDADRIQTRTRAGNHGSGET